MSFPFLAVAGAGAGASLLGSLFGKGKKVKVPPLPRVDFSAVAKQAISDNLASLQDTKKIAKAVNKFNQTERLGQLRQGVPGFDALTKAVSERISGFVAGEIPQDVAQAIGRSGAAAGISSGLPGTGFARNRTARDLGLTSLQLTQQGLNSASRWLQTMAALTVPGQFDVSSMFITPAQRASLEVQQNRLQFQRDLAAAQAAAAPNPTLAAFGSALGGLGGIAAGVGLQGALLKSLGFSEGLTANQQIGLTTGATLTGIGGFG